jgi:hypothetical protein
MELFTFLSSYDHVKALAVGLDDLDADAKPVIRYSFRRKLLGDRCCGLVKRKSVHPHIPIHSERYVPIGLDEAFPIDQLGLRRQ